MKINDAITAVMTQLNDENAHYDGWYDDNDYWFKLDTDAAIDRLEEMHPGLMSSEYWWRLIETEWSNENSRLLVKWEKKYNSWFKTKEFKQLMMETA